MLTASSQDPFKSRISQTAESKVSRQRLGDQINSHFIISLDSPAAVWSGSSDKLNWKRLTSPFSDFVFKSNLMSPKPETDNIKDQNEQIGNLW